MSDTVTPLRPSADQDPLLGVTYETRLQTFKVTEAPEAITEGLDVLGRSGWQVVSVLDRYGSAWELTFLLQRRRLV